jgi:Protein of unknown function (DUF2892)
MGINRLARIAAGLLLLSLPIFAASAWKWLGSAVGLVLLLTALAVWCPAYDAFGVRTCLAKSKR